MIIYLIFNSLMLIKLILYLLVKILLIPNLFAKCLLIILSSTVLCICYKYPRTHILIRKDILQYALKTLLAHIYNYCAITCYLLIFVLGIFYLRYLNIDKKLDLLYYYHLINRFFTQFFLYEIVINSFIIISCIILYIVIIYKLTLYFKFQIMKRHIYLIGDSNSYNKYHKFIQNYCFLINVHTNIPSNIKSKIHNLYYKLYFNRTYGSRFINFNKLTFEQQLNFEYKNPIPLNTYYYIEKLSKIIKQVLIKGHYMVMLMVILYDIIYNHMIITNIFEILPWVFFYELFIRFSKFIDDLWLPYDQALHDMIYCKELEEVNEDTLLIDGEYRDKSFFESMYKDYVKRGFVKDPHKI